MQMDSKNINGLDHLGCGYLNGPERGLPAEDLNLFGHIVVPGTRKNLEWIYPFDEAETAAAMVVHVVNGKFPGPILCLTAAIHGDELNGIAIIRRIIDGLNPETLHGTVIGIPIVNLAGFNHHRRNISGEVDLNRCFPGSAVGNYPDQVADGIFQDIITHCDAVVDLHTGSSLRENMVQLRADLSNLDVAHLSAGFGDMSVLQSYAITGTLRQAATDAGIAAIVMEVGGSRGVENDKVLTGEQGVISLLRSAGMVGEEGFVPAEQHVYLGGGWVHAEVGGILVNRVELGIIIEEGQLLADIIDPFSSEVHHVLAPFTCTVLGRAHSQQVEPGFRLFRLAMRRL
ncbi:deacylase [Desulforhopalus sp. 52FAK]